ncbi:MAG: hypothetical protein PHD02_00600 [Bacilli bacterium]|nr:hypothetical protein [Bacilli bacterium]
MKFIKENKVLSIAILIFLILMIFAGVGLYKIIIPDSGESLYGNRLDGIESVPISEETISEIKSEIIATEKVETVEYDLKGKLANFMITVKADTDKVSAEALTDKILSNLTDEQKDFYDIQIFLATTEESEIYPIIGYKHTTSLNFTWSNN